LYANLKAGTTAAEFGVPGSLASIVGTLTGSGYNIYKISGIKTETSKTPMGILSNKFYMFILVDSDSTEITQFKRQFGGASYNL
jgi:acetolactate synthase small subunit